MNFRQLSNSIRPEFGNMYEELIESVRDAYNRGQNVADWQRDFKKEQAELLNAYDED